MSSLAKLHSNVRVLEFAQLAVSPLYMSPIYLTNSQSKLSNLLPSLVQPQRLTFNNQEVRYVDQHVKPPILRKFFTADNLLQDSGIASVLHSNFVD